MDAVAKSPVYLLSSCFRRLRGDRGLTAKRTLLPCQNCRCEAAKWTPRGCGESKAGGRAAGCSEHSTGTEGERGTSIMLGGDGTWQGAWRGARGRCRAGRHRDGCGRNASAAAVPGLSGHGERHGALPARGGSSVGRGGDIESGPHRHGVEGGAGNGWSPFPVFCLTTERSSGADAWRGRNPPGSKAPCAAYFLPGPIAPWMMLPRTPESVPSGRTAIWTLEASSLLTRKDA